MAYLQLPARSDIPAYEYQIELEKQLYGLSFAWNERSQMWTMDLMDLNGEPLLSGVRLTTGVPLLNRFVLEGLPPGTFFCNDTTGHSKDPGRDTFGTQVLLIYRESTTVDE